MRGFMRTLGKVLMWIGIIFLFAYLSCSVSILRNTEGPFLQNLFLLLVILGIQFGIFKLGQFLYRRFSDKEESGKKVDGAKGKAPATAARNLQTVRQAALPVMSSGGRKEDTAEAAGARDGEPARTKEPDWIGRLQTAFRSILKKKSGPAENDPDLSAREPSAGIPGAELPLRRYPLPEEGPWTLYENPEAKSLAAEDYRMVVPERLTGEFYEDRPLIRLNTVQLGELFSGSLYREEESKIEIPEELRKRVNPGELLSFLREELPVLSEDGILERLSAPAAEEYCRLMRETASLPHCEQVYCSAPPPLSPEDRERAAGKVRFWLRMRSRGKRPEALEEIRQIARKGKAVLLTDDPSLLFDLPEEKRKKLEKNKIGVWLRIDGNNWIDLVSGNRIHMGQEEK